MSLESAPLDTADSTVAGSREVHSLPTVTVAVVVRNSEALIGRTLESIVGQTYPGMSIVVVDGNSTDGTLAAAQKFSAHIAELVSEPDRGVYDGMNKAARLAPGEFIIYMNAGDVFASRTALLETMTAASPETDLVIGRYLFESEPYPRVIAPMSTAKRVELLQGGKVMESFQDWVCHQATITRVDYLLSLGGYDLGYNLIADQDFLLRAHDDGARVDYVEPIVCRYAAGGMSSDPIKSSQEFMKLFGSRKYNRRKLRAYFNPGTRGRLRRWLKPLALRTPVVGRLYRQRNEAITRLGQLEARVNGSTEIDPAALAQLGVHSFAQFAAEVGAEDKIMQSHATIWDMPAESAGVRAPGIHFLTFADGGPTFRNALRRISREAEAFNVFETIDAHDLETASTRYPDFAGLRDYMRANPRGLGYWIWKPFLVRARLQEIPDGDVLFYADAGCELSRYGLPHFAAMVASARARGHLFFRMNQYPELSWTKRETVHAFEEEYGKRVENIGQVAATMFFFRKTPETLRFCDEWLRLAQLNDGALIDDKLSAFEAPGFRDHRHDQSLFSCLAQVSGFRNAADSDDHCAFRSPRDWNDDLLMLELPVFWSHRKADGTDRSDINLRVELMRLRAYSFLASSRYGWSDPKIWSKYRAQIQHRYRDLGAVA